MDTLLHLNAIISEVNFFARITLSKRTLQDSLFGLSKAIKLQSLADSYIKQLMHVSETHKIIVEVLIQNSTTFIFNILCIYFLARMCLQRFPIFK